MQENSREVTGEAMRRSLLTGTSFRHSMRRENLRRSRQIEAGKLIPTAPVDEVAGEEVQLPETAHVPQVETTQTPPPVAETDPAPQQAVTTTKAKTTKSAKSRTKTVKSEDVATQVPGSSPDDGAFPTDTTTATHLDAAYQEKCKNIGRRVTWTAFGTAYEGDIVHVIPVGVTPRAQNIAAGGATTPARDHLSYVVKKDDGTLVWPVMKSLSPVQAAA